LTGKDCIHSSCVVWGQLVPRAPPGSLRDARGPSLKRGDAAGRRAGPPVRSRSPAAGSGARRTPTRGLGLLWNPTGTFLTVPRSRPPGRDLTPPRRPRRPRRPAARPSPARRRRPRRRHRMLRPRAPFRSARAAGSQRRRRVLAPLTLPGVAPPPSPMRGTWLLVGVRVEEPTYPPGLSRIFCRALIACILGAKQPSKYVWPGAGALPPLEPCMFNYFNKSFSSLCFSIFTSVDKCTEFPNPVKN
jgi:hypothetical protein